MLKQLIFTIAHKKARVVIKRHELFIKKTNFYGRLVYSKRVLQGTRAHNNIGRAITFAQF